MTDNPSGISPTGYCVLVKRHKAPRKRGSIIVPDSSLEREDGGMTRGEIVAMSPLAFNFAEWTDDHPPPRVGDVVLFKRYAWAPVEAADGGDYWLIQDKDVQAVLDQERWSFVDEEESRDAA